MTLNGHHLMPAGEPAHRDPVLTSPPSVPRDHLLLVLAETRKAFEQGRNLEGVLNLGYGLYLAGTKPHGLSDIELQVEVNRTVSAYGDGS